MTIHARWRAALGVAALLALSGAAAAAPAYVRSTVNLRAGPDTGSEIIGKIPGGSRVEASNCAEWCQVTWQGKSGYAIKSALDTSGRAVARRAAGVPGAPVPYDVDDDDVVVAGAPVYYGAPIYYGYPYPYYRPYGYYRFRGYGPRYYGWRRRW